jgi:hypothetical protein
MDSVIKYRHFCGKCCTVKTEAAGSFERSVNFWQAVRRHSTEHGDVQQVHELKLYSCEIKGRGI